MMMDFLGLLLVLPLKFLWIKICASVSKTNLGFGYWRISSVPLIDEDVDGSDATLHNRLVQVT
jgi:hypothetical protein